MQKPGEKKAMISSTAIDLPEHRKQVRDACLCETVYPIGMESIPPRDADAVRVSMEMVDQADIYIGVFGWRYGHIPEGHDVSITELEFNRAVQRGIEILIFVIHDDHLVVKSMVETSDSAQKKLSKLKRVACKGRIRGQFKSPEELRAQVIQALSAYKHRHYVKQTPVDLIRAEKLRLQKLDPNASVQIVADQHGAQYHIDFPVPKPNFLEKIAPEKMKGLFEVGQSFEIKAKEIPSDISPILNELLRGSPESTVTFHSGAKFRGCIQLLFQTNQNGQMLAQIDGGWTVGRKRATFVGQLPDSPLHVEYVRSVSDAGVPESPALKCKMDFGAWEGQPLLHMAYFPELIELAGKPELTVRSLIKGNQPWPLEGLNIGIGREQAVGALAWLKRCRDAAQTMGINPSFPKADTINAVPHEAQELELMLKLLESRCHEQDNVGKDVCLTAERQAVSLGGKHLTANWNEPIKKINFLGATIEFGPLDHTWTDLELLRVDRVSDTRMEMLFKGGSESKWRIEYNPKPERCSRD